MLNKAIHSNSLAPYRMSRLSRPMPHQNHQNWLESLVFVASFEWIREIAATTFFYLPFQWKKWQRAHWNSYHSSEHFPSSVHHLSSAFSMAKIGNIEFSQFNQHIASTSNAHLALPQLRWQAIARAAQKRKKNKMTIKIAKRNFLSSSLVWFQWCVHMNQNKYENMFEQGVYLRKMWIAQFLCCQNIL